MAPERTNMNKVILCGRLTDDVKVEQNGKGENATKWANFTIAVRDGVDTEGNPRTQFIRCVIFGKSAEILAQFTGKGEPICVSGRIKVNFWDDEEEVRHWSTTVQVDDFDLIGARKTEAEEEKKPAKPAKKYHK